LLSRPPQQAELSRADMRNGVPTLLAKIALYQPRTVCFLGKQIGELFLKEARMLANTISPPMALASSASPTKADAAVTESKFSLTLEEDTLLGRSKTRCKVGAKREKAAKPTFQWGFQPFKAIHPNSSPVKETLFFVMPSSSGRVTGYQVGFIVFSSGRISELTPFLTAPRQGSDSADVV
jgi:thymine-DNA glycosylase